MGKRVVILGGGMAALSTAWRITQATWRQDFDSVHIYQMGWRLGGKCATGRGPMRRIEEHGIHLFGGGYYNTLPMMREVYRELHGEAAGDAAFDAAFLPQQSSVRVRPRGWRKQVLRFPRNATGQADAAGFAKVSELHRWLAAAVQGLLTYLGDADDETATSPVLMLRLYPPALETIVQALRMTRPAVTPADAMVLLQALLDALQARRLDEADALAAQIEAAGDGLWPVAPDAPLNTAEGAIGAASEQAGDQRVLALGMGLLTWSLTLDFIAAVARSWLAWMRNTRPLQALDTEAHDALLARHGMRPATLQSDLVLAPLRILYQFRDDAQRRAEIGAGCFLHWVLRSFAYAEVPFWFFREGTGETVIRPLYQALRARGVEFHFFHRVEAIEPSADGRSIAKVRMRLQADLLAGQVYEPLDGGCWPDRPLFHQLANGDELAALPAHELESYWSTYRSDRQVVLDLAPQADAVVLAIPPAALPAIAPRLLDLSSDWRAMAAAVASVETQSLQVWLDASSHALGVNERCNQTLQSDDTFLGAGFVDGFHTFADFSPLIAEEAWDGHNRPQALWYFSDVLFGADAAPDFSDPQYPVRRQADARAAVRAFLPVAFGGMLPGSPPQAATNPPTAPSFDLRHLVVPDPASATLPVQRIDQQWIRANVQPSDRYVQALPGSTDKRLDAGRSAHFGNLYLAGDWTYNGLNVGCVEATVMSGKLAGNALRQTADPHVDVHGYFGR